MSAHVVMVGANTYIGVVAAHVREMTTDAIKQNDSRRLIWTKLILPTVMKKSFIDRVVTSQENHCSFVIDVNGPNSPLIPGNLDGLDVTGLSSHYHTAYYQNFSQVTNNNVPMGMTPWQIRFQFAKPTLNTLLTFTPGLLDEITAIFKNNGWMFWLTDMGFTITPLDLHNNLKDVSDAFLVWMNIRDKPLYEVSPQFVDVIPDASNIVRVE
jgi:hypothetical protein